MRTLGAFVVVAVVAGACSNGHVDRTIPAMTATTTTVTVVTTAAVTTSSTADPTTTTAATTTTVSADGPPVVDMVPAGGDIEDFVPLVLGYFAVRNWALEHPDEVTEEILGTVIEAGSVEMRDTLDEIAALVEQGARYEGLTETFELVDLHFAAGTDSPDVGRAEIATTYQYGTTHFVQDGFPLSEDTLRRAAWTLRLQSSEAGKWLVVGTLREEPVHAPGGS